MKPFYYNNNSYPFGSYLAGSDRKTTETTYDYGFNGKRKDPEMYNVSGSSYDFDARLYNSRLGRWLSTDPLQAKYQSHSPFNYGLNNPNYYVDRNGKEIVILYGPNYERYVYGSGIEPPDDPFVKEAIKSLRAICLHDESGKIVEEIKASKKFTLEIRQSVYGNTEFHPGITIDKEKSDDPQGRILENSGDLQFDLNTGIKEKKSDGTNGEAFGPFIALFHEMGHAHRYMKLLETSSSNIEALKTFDSNRAYLDEIWIRMEEKETVRDYEIPICKYFGVLQRKAYVNGYTKATDFKVSTDAGNGTDVMGTMELVKPKDWKVEKNIVIPVSNNSADGKKEKKKKE